MKKLTLIFSVFFTVASLAQAKVGSSNIPIEVERNINKFYQEMDISQRSYYVNQNKKAYLDMMNYINSSEIPNEEKEGILRNVESMYPNNYIMQRNEAINRVDYVKSLMK